jgi:proteasome accessory factor C
MSHDTDKLIRQLSLVAFLMAERRPLTARDVKQNVEGYSEMSDEAFARRFYADRSELMGLGVPLHSQRDEFTGEELYTLRSERYFLPELDLSDEELEVVRRYLVAHNPERPRAASSQWRPAHPPSRARRRATAR